MKRKESMPIVILILFAFLGGVYYVRASFQKRVIVTADAVVPMDLNNNNNSNKSEKQNSNLNVNQNVINSNDNNNSQTQTKLTNLSLPILMYHHIRDYNDLSDQIGINLSVAPTKFAAELDLIKSKGYITVTFYDLEMGNIPEKPIILTFDDGYENFYKYAYPELKIRGMKAVSFIITNKVGTGDYMTRDQLIEISNNNIEIGSHTLSHPDLSKASPVKVMKELSESKKYLEDLTVKKIISFCYPSGKFNADTENLVREAGYDFAVTTKSGISKFDNKIELNRYRINSDTSISSFIK